MLRAVFDEDGGFMTDFLWGSLPQAVQAWVSSAAVVLGGCWALYRFGLRRERETALAMSMTPVCAEYGSGRYFILFDVTLTNKGSVRVVSKKARMHAYKDHAETLNYSGDLLVRRVPSEYPECRQLRWFADPSSAALPASASVDIEADLLEDYVNARGETEFWMEPGESYHVNAAIVLTPGLYLAKVTFIADDGDDEFWRRVFLVQVPPPQESAATRAGSAD
jgi:hypothetical protein